MHPLVVDLDGTLIHTDMLHESALKALKDKPWKAVSIPLMLMNGKAALKQYLAKDAVFDATALPYNQPLIAWLKEQKANGRTLILCTASDSAIAQPIANHLDIFDEVIASDGTINLAGKNKAAALQERFGQQGFDYAGNSRADIKVWEVARRAVVVNASGSVARNAQNSCEIEQVFSPEKPALSTWRRMLRVHQWLKNMLLFVPILAAHQATGMTPWIHLVIAFFAFSLCASSVYIANDLLDLESDRIHPRKRKRPFASGAVPVWIGVALSPVLLIAGLGLSLLVGTHFLGWLVFYYVLTLAYSFGLKKIVLVDCLMLALLYTLRVIAGAAAAENVLSYWLLGFSVFLFLSLAFVKRYAELEIQRHGNKEKVHGRGYYTTDAPLIQTMGITAGYAAVLVLALYINSGVIVALYHLPEVIWCAVPVMLFWISWMWMQAHRGNMHDDPLVFAVKDRASLVAGIIFVCVMAVGAIGLPW